MNIAEHSVKYWPIYAAAVAVIGGSAVAADKIMTLEDAVKAQAQSNTFVVILQTEMKILQKSVDAQQSLLIQILQKVQ